MAGEVLGKVGIGIDKTARVEAERLVHQHSPAFLEALLRALQEIVPRRRGRPEGSGEEDHALLEKMAELLALGNAKSIRDAARQVARRHPGHSEASTERRLRRKFSKEWDSGNDSSSNEEVEHCFEEDVETWDL